MGWDWEAMAKGLAHTAINQPTGEWFAATDLCLFDEALMGDDAGTYLILPLPGPFWKCHLVILAMEMKGNGWEDDEPGPLQLLRDGAKGQVFCFCSVGVGPFTSVISSHAGRGAQ
jgi:hypothetical protein